MTMYSAQFNGVAVTAQQDLFELNAPSGGICYVHRCLVTQTSDFGDAQAEGLSVLIKRGATTTGSGGSTPTAVPLNPIDPAFGGTVKANNTTKATAGTIVTLHPDSWVVQAGWDYLATPECRLIVPASGRMTFELASTPADSITCNGVLYFEYLGS